MNNHEDYNKLAKQHEANPYYYNQMYIMDLEQDARLTKIIEYFINNINQPKRLELVA